MYTYRMTYLSNPCSIRKLGSSNWIAAHGVGEIHNFLEGMKNTWISSFKTIWWPTAINNFCLRWRPIIWWKTVLAELKIRNFTVSYVEICVFSSCIANENSYYTKNYSLLYVKSLKIRSPFPNIRLMDYQTSIFIPFSILDAHYNIR